MMLVWFCKVFFAFGVFGRVWNIEWLCDHFVLSLTGAKEILHSIRRTYSILTRKSNLETDPAALCRERD